jgi:membrane fusion protein (multidrug efflux system)
LLFPQQFPLAKPPFIRFIRNGTGLFYFPPPIEGVSMPDGQQNATLTEGSTNASPRKPSRRRFLILGAAVVALVGVAFWLINWWTTGRFVETTNNAYLQADSVVISPKISGYVKEVLVRDNELVAAGAPLARIDSAPYQAAQDMAEAEIAQRRADLVRFQADAARQEAARAEAVAQVSVAEAAARFAAEDAARFQRLAKTGADTTQHRDQAESMRDQTAGQARAARAAVDTTSRQLDSLKAQIGQGEAALQAAQARVKGTRSDLDGVTVESPIAGRVGDRTIRIGQFVQPGTRMMTIVPMADIYLVANFKETQVGRMRPGQPVAVTIDALPDAKISGTVDSLAPGTGTEFALLPPENATGNFTKIVQRVPVRIRLNADSATRELLRPGLSAEVEVNTKTGASQ